MNITYTQWADLVALIEAGLTDVTITSPEQGDLVVRNSAGEWINKHHGTAGQALVTGGNAADPSWAAPAPAAHKTTHQDGGTDEISLTGLLGTSGALTTHASGADHDGRYFPLWRYESFTSAGTVSVATGVTARPGQVVLTPTYPVTVYEDSYVQLLVTAVGMGTAAGANTLTLDIYNSLAGGTPLAGGRNYYAATATAVQLAAQFVIAQSAGDGAVTYTLRAFHSAAVAAQITSSNLLINVSRA